MLRYSPVTLDYHAPYTWFSFEFTSRSVCFWYVHISQICGSYMHVVSLLCAQPRLFYVGGVTPLRITGCYQNTGFLICLSFFLKTRKGYYAIMIIILEVIGQLENNIWLVRF